MASREVSEQLDRAVAVTFKGWRVEMQVTAHDWSATPGDSAPVGVPPTSGKWMPPLGAFEIFLAWDVLDAKRSVLLHSKLQTRKFPDVFDMLASVVRLIGTHSAVLASSSQNM